MCPDVDISWKDNYSDDEIVYRHNGCVGEGGSVLKLYGQERERERERERGSGMHMLYICGITILYIQVRTEAFKTECIIDDIV